MKLACKLIIKFICGFQLKQICIPLLSIVLFTNCSSTLMLPGASDYQKQLDDINYLGSRHWSKVFLIDSKVFSSSDLIISPDSLIFHDDEADKTMCVNTNEIERIVILDTTTKIFSSFWIGLGNSIGAFLITSAIHDCGTCHPDLLPLIVGVAALPIGFIAGTMFTGEKEYVFKVQTE